MLQAKPYGERYCFIGTIFFLVFIHFIGERLWLSSLGFLTIYTLNVPDYSCLELQIFWTVLYIFQKAMQLLCSKLLFNVLSSDRHLLFPLLHCIIWKKFIPVLQLNSQNQLGFCEKPLVGWEQTDCVHMGMNLMIRWWYICVHIFISASHFGGNLYGRGDRVFLISPLMEREPPQLLMFFHCNSMKPQC